jgi:hypothetical protein
MTIVRLSSGRSAPRTNVDVRDRLPQLTNMSPLTSLEPVLERIRGEYHESPGLRLTHWQFQRLWNLDPDQARTVIDQLVQTRFLRGARDGTFVRCERP